MGITTNPPSEIPCTTCDQGLTAVDPLATGGVATWDNTQGGVSGSFVITPNAAPVVPEPTSLALWGAAAAAVAWLRRRRSKSLAA